MTEKLQALLKEAERLRERGPQTMDPEDEARHLADQTLTLLIELIVLLLAERI